MISSSFTCDRCKAVTNQKKDEDLKFFRISAIPHSINFGSTINPIDGEICFDVCPKCCDILKERPKRKRKGECEALPTDEPQDMDVGF